MNGFSSENGTVDSSAGAEQVGPRTAGPETGVRAASGVEPQAASAAAGAAAGDAAVDDDGAEVAALETLLADRARQLEQQQSELSRTRALLRDALERFETGIGAGSEQGAAGLRRERDLAVGRALEAEAARADIRFRLDEVMGHLAAAGAAPAALADTQEARDVAQAQLVLAQQDLLDARSSARAFERELAETREQLELSAMTPARLAERSAGGLEAEHAAALQGERDGLRARADESERAFAAAHAALAATHDQLARARAELASAAEERRGLVGRVAELEQALAREKQNRAELEVELSRARAERMAVSEELSRAHDEVSQARASAQGRDTERARAFEALAGELDSARRAGAAPQARVDRQAETLRATRELLSELAVALRGVMERRGGDLAGSAGAEDDPHAGVPTYIEAVEGLEVELAAHQERVKQLESRLAAAAAAARELAANPELSSAVAEIAELRALLERGPGRSSRPPAK